MPRVTILIDDTTSSFEVKKGENLLQALKNNNINIYGSLSSKLNCVGNGICATCGVYLIDSKIKPKHWHDKLASKFGYPRLACQIMVEKDLTIKKPDNKIIWGQLLPDFTR